MRAMPPHIRLYALAPKPRLDGDALDLAADVAAIAENAAAIAALALVGWRAALERVAKLEAMIGTGVE
jgi:hypothetical protein